MQRNYKIFIKGITIVAIVTFIIIHFIIRGYKDMANVWELESIWGDIGYTTVIVSLVMSIFNCLLWRIPFVGRCLHTPNIRGQWFGKGKSSCNNLEYSFSIKIDQSFLQTRVHGNFTKSKSDSFSSAFVHYEEIDKTILIYSYKNEPNIEYRNRAERKEEDGLSIHYGTAKLDIDYDNLTELHGTYWNDRQCVGSWVLTKKDKNGK
jgi:hypothetical protein